MKKTVLCSATFFLVCLFSYGQNENVQEKVYDFTPGLIFNTSNILFNLDEYQSGVGIKLKNSSYSIRALLNIRYESSTDELDSNLGITYEWPFFTGRVAPYWGIGIKGGLNLVKDTLQETTTIAADIVGVLGTEVYLFDFLSVFAEYNAGISISHVSISQNSSETTRTNYAFGTALGNEGSIGIVIYLENRPLHSQQEKQSED